VEQITLSIILKDSGLYDKPPRLNGVNTYLAIFIAVMALTRYGIQLVILFYLAFGIVKLVTRFLIYHKSYDGYVFFTKIVIYSTIFLYIFSYIVQFLVFLCIYY
jgi:hypothetical protein